MTATRTTMMRPRRTLRAAWAVGTTLVLAACGASYSTPDEVALPAPVTASTVAAAQTAPCEDHPAQGSGQVPAVASYPPLEALPAPGAMPAGSYMAEIFKRGKLIVGTSIDTPLFSAVDPDSTTSEIKGFDVDMAKLVADAIFGTWVDHLELRGITYAQRIPQVSSGAVDLVAHTMTINCKRWQQVAFSGVYLFAGQKLLVAKDSPVAAIGDLGGHTVCVSAGGTSADEMRGLALQPPVEVIEVANQTDCVVAFQRGDADVIRSDDTVLAGFATQDKAARVVGEPLTEEPYGMATNLAHPEFTRFVNAVLEKAKADGTWQKTYDAWLRTPLPEFYSNLVVVKDQPVIKTLGIPVGNYTRPLPKS